MKKKHFCFICARPCAESDRNSDGTYAHMACLRPHQVPMLGKSAKGGNLYRAER